MFYICCIIKKKAGIGGGSVDKNGGKYIRPIVLFRAQPKTMLTVQHMRRLSIL